jgi:alpha-L-rhamnosidase
MMPLIACCRKSFFSIVFSILLLTGPPGFLVAQSSCTPVNLQCEYLINPIGIDAAHPRLSWQLQDNRPGARQTAWRLSVGTDSAEVSRGIGRQWQFSLASDAGQRIVYSGRALQPFTRYFWMVQVGDKDGLVSAMSPIASFETGMMDSRNWKGAWISDSRDIKEKAAPYFRKAFDIKQKIKSARAYIAVAGLYELYINGIKTGDHRLDPMYTRFDRRLLYITHDVTAQLQSGANAIGVLLGNGWYNHQSTAV